MVSVRYRTHLRILITKLSRTAIHVRISCQGDRYKNEILRVIFYPPKPLLSPLVSQNQTKKLSLPLAKTLNGTLRWQTRLVLIHLLIFHRIFSSAA